MKRVFTAVITVCLLCAASAYAGGEVPAPRYAIQQPVQVCQAQPSPGFFTRAGNYGQNVVCGTFQFVGKGVSTIVYTGTLGAVDLDNSAAYKPGFWD